MGAAALPLLGAYLLVKYGWQSVFFVPGTVAIITSIFLVNRLRDTPESLGLPTIEKYRNDYPRRISKQEAEKELSYREILMDYILTNKWIWIITVSYFMIYVIRWTISHWVFYFLVNSQHYSEWEAAKCLGWYEIGGFFGGLAAGWISDLVFKGRRAIVNLLYFLALPPFLMAFSHFSSINANPTIIQLIMGALGFLVFGPQMLLAVHAVEITHKNASATAIGFLGIIAYLGAAITGGPLGYFIKHGGWQNIFTLLLICSLTGALCCIPFFYFKERHIKTE